LTQFAKLYGRELIEETDTQIKVAQTRAGSQILRFEKLALLEFSSDRKRMSKIVRHPDGRI
jgi:magnesium-transporting ATPase (P-type)